MLVRENDRTKVMNKKRMMMVFFVILLLMCLLLFRVAWIQIVKADEYTELAVNQQKGDVPIEAKRGTIFDRNGKELASSATSYHIWLMPAEAKKYYSDSKIADYAEDLAPILSQSRDDILKSFRSKSTIVKLAEYQDKQVVDKVNELGISGISVSSTTKRFYPMGSFASQVLGSVNDDNVGRSGLELEYDQYLSGVSGRWIRNSDINGNPLSFGSDKYYGAEDGLNVTTTLDEVLQHYLEKAVATGMEKTKAVRITAVAMDPKTGEILAMTNTPNFDPNKPMEPAKEDKEKFKKMNETEKTEYLSNMWRNAAINDVYEPGSTFKLLTTSVALEEGIAKPDTVLTCRGHENISGIDIFCFDKNVHGSINVKKAVAESCNCIQMQLGANIGAERYFEYMDMFGITRPTGVDYPAEALPVLTDRTNFNPVNMATMYFGQGFSITPIQLVSAVCSIGNDGILMQPHFVRSLENKDGKTIKEFKPTQVRKVMSKETAAEMRDIMEFQVNEGGGRIARIEGVRIGGKTGTSEVVRDGKYTTDTYGSFIAMAPMDDPKIVVLVAVDSPKTVKYGVLAAAPIVKEFLQNGLPYLGVQTKFAESGN